MTLLALVLGAAVSAAPVWHDAFEPALADAKAAGAKILVDFHAPWCYSCYYMEKHVLAKPGFAKAAKGLVLAKVDVDREEGRALKERYGVTFLPTFLILDAEGKALGRILGEQKESDFLKRLAALVKGEAGEPAALRRRLAAGELKAAAEDVRDIPAGRLETLRQDKAWRVLEARLAVRRSPEDAGALAALLRDEDSCDLAYDVSGAKIPESLKPVARRALEAVVEKRVFGKPACADRRSPVAELAALQQELGDAPARAALLERMLKALAGKPGADRNRDDDRRYFLELAGDAERVKDWYEKLVAAYPADYVYAHRYAKWLLGRGDAAAALPWSEKADRLAYGANRLAVTGVRAKALAALGRKEEAAALLRRDAKAGQAAFPKEARELEAQLDGLGL